MGNPPLEWSDGHAQRGGEKRVGAGSGCTTARRMYGTIHWGGVWGRNGACALRCIDCAERRGAEHGAIHLRFVCCGLLSRATKRGDRQTRCACRKCMGEMYGGLTIKWVARMGLGDSHHSHLLAGWLCWLAGCVGSLAQPMLPPSLDAKCAKAKKANKKRNTTTKSWRQQFILAADCCLLRAFFSQVVRLFVCPIWLAHLFAPRSGWTAT